MLEFDRLKRENEALKRAAEFHRAKYFEAWEVVSRWRKLSERWHGKYAIVKHENNQLRRKLKRQEVQE